MSSHDAPPLQVDEWLNTTGPLDLASLRGKVVLLHAFQMLCPGCLMHGLPQAERAHRLFGKDGVVVIGLHTVFEHHAVMGPEALRAFNHEYQWSFPIGIDRPAARGAIPLTMQAYDLRGTPSLVLLDRGGRVRLQHFGSLDDLALGAAIGRLLSEEAPRG
ncbi:redoxin domain-containing protein, partial [Achromobacter denitrificans]